MWAVGTSVINGEGVEHQDKDDEAQDTTRRRCDSRAMMGAKNMDGETRRKKHQEATL